MGNKLPKLESQLNLVNAAIAEYDFLRLVDKHPALYSAPFLENALYRYETYWLPLCKDHPDIILPAPLDIEWVWHTHILNPYAYRKDCQQIVGVVIDHKPATLSQNFINKARDLWQNKYRDIPFEVNLNEPNSVPLSPDYQRKSSYDIVSAAQRQRSFNYNSSLPHFRDRRFLSKAVKRYKIMLQIKRDNPNAFVVPCYDNDLIWHTHQQHVSLYKGDTSNILGSMLDHDDSTSDRSPGSHLEKSSDQTRKLWRKAGVKFGVPGAMYRGDVPLPLIDTNPNRFLGLANQYDFKGYCFYTSQLVRTMQQSNHIKDVLHHVALMAPNTLYKDSAPCEYNDNILKTNAGTHAFTWRVVHCRNPTISALEILDVYGNVVATAHTIGSFSLPLPKHVEETLKCATHSAKTERSMLIRGAKGDYAILRTSWVNFVKGRNPGTLKAEILILDGKDSYWCPISPTTVQGGYQWTLKDGVTGTVDFEKGNISFNSQVTAVGEWIALGCALSISFVLCQPRPPPPKENGVVSSYPAPSSTRPNVMHVDNMDLLVAGGLYSNHLPRWYHARCHGGYFYQIHPNYLHYHHHHYYGGCGAGDFGYDYDAGGATFDGDGDGESGGWASGVDSGDGDGFDFGTSESDSGGGDWGGSSGDAGGCGGCGGGGGAGCGSSGGGCGSSGGGCGSSGGGGGGGGGCGSSCGGGGGCGGGGCGGD